LPGSGLRADSVLILRAVVCHGLFTHSRWRLRSSSDAPSSPIGRHFLGSG
jgi:hypothetical protein